MNAAQEKTPKGVWRPELSHPMVLLLALPFLASFLFLVAYPLVKLVTESFGDGNLDSYARALTDPVNQRAMFTTIWVSLAVTLISLVLAWVIAWSLRTSQSGIIRALLWISLLMPLAMSTVIQNYIWIVILGRNGLLNDLLVFLGLPKVALLYTPWAVMIAMVYTILPYAVFPMVVTFNTIPNRVLDAAHSLGGGWFTTMRTVVLPLSVPGLFITSVLVFVLAFGFYVAPVLLGGPRATFIVKVIQDDLLMRYDRSGAAASSVLMMVIALALVVVAVRIVGRERFERALG